MEGTMGDTSSNTSMLRITIESCINDAVQRYAPTVLKENSYNPVIYSAGSIAGAPLSRPPSPSSIVADRTSKQVPRGVSRNGGKKFRRFCNDEWDKYKPALRDLYVAKGLPLPRVMHIMKERHGFEASVKQYRYRFEMWEWPKYGRERQITREPSPEKMSGNPDLTPESQCHSFTDGDRQEGECLGLINLASPRSEPTSNLLFLEMGDTYNPFNWDPPNLFDWDANGVDDQDLFDTSEFCLDPSAGILFEGQL
ncbi:Clr5 domain-containing protein [Hypoxylon crocopeplum]|nr:Clr5 domain-containing protein [Hypoxylon crocopeplum]